MPLISIKSLPLVECGDMEDLLAGMSQELADATGIDRRHITMTWEYLRPRHYSEGGETRDRQPEDSHPILVSVLAPDFHRPEKVEAMILGLKLSPKPFWTDRTRASGLLNVRNESS